MTAILWAVYELLLGVVLLLYLPRAVWRRRLPHPGWRMRLGRYPRRVTEALGGRATIWVHAVSVGEVMAARPLLRALAEAEPATPLAGGGPPLPPSGASPPLCGGVPLVLSTVTPSGFQVASQLMSRSLAHASVGAAHPAPAGAVSPRGVCVYFPLDFRVCVRRALATLRPRLLVLMESELWPMIIRECRARRIPVAVVNGRISARAFGRYHLARPWLKPVLRQVDVFLMQSRTDAQRLIQLGAPADRVQVAGNLKWDASLMTRPSPQAVQETAARIGLDQSQAAIVAGSTHRQEETVLLEAFRALRATVPAARLIIAPRHVERVAEVEALIQQAGLRPVRLSRLIEAPCAAPTGSSSVSCVGPDEWDVALIDTVGQLARYYGLATVAFIGGSLIPHGGQNPLEAASLGKPLVFGPFMHNFADIAQQLLAHQAARQVADGRQLGATLTELLADPQGAQAMGRRAQEVTERLCGAAARTLAHLQPLLAARPGARF
jgi:3-deoxy-D-manno-octulosonic-acid transferase